MDKGESQLEESLRSLKESVRAPKVILRNVLDKVTESEESRSTVIDEKIPFWYRAKFLVGALAVFVAVLVGNNISNGNKEFLASDITDLLLDSQEIAFELEQMEWVLEEDMALLDIDLESEIL